EKGNSEKTSFTATGEESATYIRDADFNDNRIFDLGLPGELLPGDSIIRLEIYEQETDVNQIATTVPAKMRVDPSGATSYTEDIIPKFGVVGLQYGTEFIFEQNVADGTHFVVFNNRRLDSRALGYYMEVLRGGATVTFGSLGVDTLNLKLLRAENPLPSYLTWQLMWRNVYDLRQRGSSIGDLNVKILKGLAGSEATSANLEYQDLNGVSRNYVEVLGIDQYSNNQRKIPDGLVDDRSAIWRSDWGLLILPSRTPFDTDTTFTDENGTVTPILQEKVPTLYTLPSPIERAKDSKYYIQIATKTRSSVIRLNKANILEGSERILLNGRPLKSGTDYNINYDFGQITLMSEEALDPNAELSIVYEYAGFLAVQKKTLLGMRAEYEWNKNFVFGSTILYKSDKAQERKPRVGQETSKMALLDFDASLKIQPNILTKMVDAIPLVEATVPSAVQLSGEIARSYPNPNVNGEAYVDDFESAIEQISLSTARTLWKRSARPKPVEDDVANYFSQGRLLWHTPVGAGENLPQVQDVYDRESRFGEGTVRTLRMVFKPDPLNIDSAKASWAGITRFFKGRIDADRLQLFEFRARGTGKLHFDFGYVSEDIDDDNIADSEDNLQPNGFVEP
ncbi:MAG TPA: cell surface protein SprA, partial [candidate division Zixibacteria bacterium]|nr:cell surface protein SprA [candidate division Zixibacteria bacterium]